MRCECVLVLTFAINEVLLLCALTLDSNNGRGFALVKPHFLIYKYLSIIKKYLLLKKYCQILSPIADGVASGSTTTPSTATATPPSVTPSPDPQYMLVQQKLSWMDAHIYCKTMGYELTTVEDQQEFQLLQNLITQSGLPMSEYFWTSGNDLFREGMFTWLSTGNPITTFFPAGNPEPNGGMVENCVDMYFNGAFNQYIMADFPCTDMSYFICKRN